MADYLQLGLEGFDERNFNGLAIPKKCVIVCINWFYIFISATYIIAVTGVDESFTLT